MLKKKLLRRYSRDLTLRSLPFAYTTTLLAWVTFAPLCALGVAANEAREGPVAAQPLHVHALGDEATLRLVPGRRTRWDSYVKLAFLGEVEL